MVGARKVMLTKRMIEVRDLLNQNYTPQMIAELKGIKIESIYKLKSRMRGRT